MASMPKRRPHYRARTDPKADAHQHGKNKLVEWRLKGRRFGLVNGQLKEVSSGRS